MGRARRRALKDRLQHEHLQLDVPKIQEQWCCHVLQNVTAVAHEFTFYVCTSLCFKILDGSGWIPNNVVKTRN